MTDWIIGTSAAALSLTIAVAAFFIQKWISSVDETLKEHSNELKQISQTVARFKDAQKNSTEGVYEIIRAEIRGIKLPKFHQLETMQDDITEIKKTVTVKVLPQLEQQRDSLGKIILIEKQLNDQDQKIFKIFEATRILADRIQKNPK